MKVSDSILQSQIQRAVASRSQALSQLQIAIASGVKYSRRSENPAETAAASILERSTAMNRQWQQNVDHALAWTRTTEGYMTQLVELMHRADELAVQAGDPTASAVDRQRVADQVDAVLESLVAISNTRHQGIYLFGGTYSDQPPIEVTRDGAGAITAVQPRVPNAPQRTAQIDEGLVWTYGATVAGDGGVVIDNATGHDAFQALISLRDELGAGGSPSQAAKGAIEANRDHAITALVDVGLAQGRYESLAVQHDRAELELTTRSSELVDVDLAEALTELSQLEATLQASLQMAARLNQLKFSDYL